MVNEIHYESQCRELQKIAGHHGRQQKLLGHDLDEALISAMEYFYHHPISTTKPDAVFRVCLRRERAKRLKYLEKEENS